jgi:competence protein ComEC
VIARWPQHHVVAAAVVALVVAPRWPLALPLVAAVAWASQPRRGWAVAAVVVALLAGVGGSWRLAEARSAASAPLAAGTAVRPDEPVDVLEQAERSLDGGWRTTARLRGTTVELRTPAAVSAPGLAVGRRVRVAGRLRPLGERSVGARARGIALTLDARVVGVAGRRGGWRGAIDRIRERAERTLTDAGEARGGADGSAGAARGALADGAGGSASGAGAAAGPRTALLRGMVLGQDAGFGDEQEEAYRRSGLSHLVAASGQNVALLAAVVIGIGTLVGIGRPWRIGWALLAVVVYVPLAGGGPSIRRAGVMGVLTLLALALGGPAPPGWAVLCAAAHTVVGDTV